MTGDRYGIVVRRLTDCAIDVYATLVSEFLYRGTATLTDGSRVNMTSCFQINSLSAKLLAQVCGLGRR